MPFTREILAELFEGLDQEWTNLLKITLRAEMAAALTKLYEKDPAWLCPKPRNVFAFARECPLERARVVICAQDPYPRRSSATGLAFSVPVGEQIPGSLRNIAACIGVTPTHGDLTAWAQQGVILLNASLTTDHGVSRAHAGIWEALTAGIIAALASRGCIFIALGNDARDAYLAAGVTDMLFWGHPSPISTANKTDNPKNFVYCDCFKRANELLAAKHMQEIDWNWTGSRAQIPAGVWIFTDGGASKNGKRDCRARAAWTVVTVRGGAFAVGAVSREDVTALPSNQRAELTAIVRGLEAAAELPAPKYLVTDSQYSINCITRWYRGWVAAGKLGGKSHLDLISRAVELSDGVKFIHTRSHQPKPNTPLEEFIWTHNDRVDQACGFGVAKT